MHGSSLNADSEWENKQPKKGRIMIAVESDGGTEDVNDYESSTFQVEKM